MIAAQISVKCLLMPEVLQACVYVCFSFVCLFVYFILFYFFFWGGGYFTYKSISALFNYSVFIYLFTYLFIYLLTLLSTL